MTICPRQPMNRNYSQTAGCVWVRVTIAEYEPRHVQVLRKFSQQKKNCSALKSCLVRLFACQVVQRLRLLFFFVHWWPHVMLPRRHLLLQQYYIIILCVCDLGGNSFDAAFISKSQIRAQNCPTALQQWPTSTQITWMWAQNRISECMQWICINPCNWLCVLFCYAIIRLPE